LAAQQHSFSPSDVEAGALLYRANCLVCHGQDGDLISGVSLRHNQFRRGNSDDDLMRVISQGIPGTAMPPNNFMPAQLWGLVAYIRSMRDFQPRAGVSEDPRRGQAVFEGKGGCLSCHRVLGKGSRSGPDLSDVGVIRPVAHLERSLVEPGETILPQHRSVRAVTRDGSVVIGRRLNEDTHSIQVLDAKERLVSLSKDELREVGTMTNSPMPSYREKLSPQELADIIAYLASLKGFPKR
jgi:putative heme-binding domain-containing protein